MKKIWLLGCAVFCAFLLVGCGNNPQSVSEKFVKAAESGDSQTMKELSMGLVSTDADAAFASEALKELRLKGFKAGKEKIVKDKNGALTQACEVSCVDKKGKKHTIKTMQNNRADWKVVALD